VASNVATQEVLKTPAASIATTGRLESIDFVRGLVMVIMAWAIAVFSLYFPCAWFAALKQKRRDWWLGYL